MPPSKQTPREIREPPTGFPHYFKKQQPRIVTADVWAFLRATSKVSKKLSKNQKREAEAFIDQAFEFFEAAQNPRMSSGPLLYYYSFLNLAKVALLMGGTKIPPVIRHGIHDPKENVRQRLTLPGQAVHIVKCAHDHSQLFPEFVRVLGGEITRPRQIKVLALLRQIPAVHRTFCRVTGEGPSCLPIKHFQFFKVGKQVFLRMVLSRDDKDVKVTLDQIRKSSRFSKLFKKESVQPREDGFLPNEIWFKSKSVAGIKSTTNSALRALAKEMRKLGFSCILTSVGYRHYLYSLPPKETLPPLATIYAAMFYFGSITRYKPYDFDRIVSDRYNWLVSEFLKTQPSQFLHGLAGHIAGVDVVQPFAYIH